MNVDEVISPRFLFLSVTKSIEDWKVLQLQNILIMRRQSLLFIVLAVLTALPIQMQAESIAIDELHFPDENFRLYVQEKCDADKDGYLSDSEIDAVSTINVNIKNIADLTGIEYFTSLGILNCYRNQLKTLDLSKNTRLGELVCSNNQLTELDLSKNTMLRRLDCDDNQLTTLDLSENTRLKSLDCRYNQLERLEVSKNSPIDRVLCFNNQIQGEGWDALISSLPYSGGKIVAMRPENLEQNVVTKAHVAAAKARGWMFLSTSYSDGETEYEGIDSDISVISINEAVFPDKIFRQYILDELDMDDDSYLDYFVHVGRMNISNKGIEDLKGIEHITTLDYLNCQNNNLTVLGLSNNNLRELNCSNNQLVRLDLEKGCLKVLNCSGNQLTTLDVSNCPALTTLRCEGNKLTSLKVSKDTWLTEFQDFTPFTELYCCDNQIQGAAMDELIAGLPSTGGDFYAIRPNSRYEQNVVTKAQVAAAKAKGWTTYYYDGGWKEYEGSDSAADGIAIDELHFPDENFRNWVLAQDYGQDGVLTEEEIDNVLDINVYNQNIADLKGIEYFTALTDLECVNNQLTSLDVSKNTALTVLLCVENELTSLDVSKNTALTTLHCNNNQLSSLDVSKNTALRTLWCYHNQLTSLDVSQNTGLTDLDCSWNQLTTLDMSKNTALEVFSCSLNRLASLDVSQNTGLTDLGCSWNQLTTLDVSKNTALNYLSCSGNQLTSLDLSKNTGLLMLGCYDNQLSSLDVSHNTALGSVECYGNKINETEMDKLVESLPMVRWGEFYVKGDTNERNVITTSQVAAAKAKGWKVYAKDSGNWVEYEGDASKGIPINSTAFPDESFRNWVLAQDYGQDGVLTEEEIAAVTSINVSDKGIAHLKGIEFFTALTNLYCFDNELTMIDVSKNTALVYLDCSRNQLTSIDVSNNTALSTLDCSSNKLASLDVSSNTALRNFYCAGNQLTSLDVSQNTALRYYTCGGNQLTSIDVSKNTALVSLDCNDNQLISLDVSNNTALTQLHCFFNQIKDAAMDALIAGLPSTGGQFYATYADDGYEKNVVTPAQVAVAKKKGWTVYYYSYETWQFEEYESSDPQEITPVNEGETIDIGTEIDENTNLDGNVVGDIYYSINSGNGNYNAAEGCLVVTKPTDDSAIDGKDIFGEDFKAGYTGIVFKVNEGKGSIKVEAETQGNMVLKVKIGNSEPIEKELDGKLKVMFPYNVSEPTYVYIYGGMSTAGAKATGGTRASADADLLKIYGFEIVSDASGIEAAESGLPTDEDAPVYNLNGQRVDAPTKGIYIQNGRKVLVK